MSKVFFLLGLFWCVSGCAFMELDERLDSIDSRMRDLERNNRSATANSSEEKSPAVTKNEKTDKPVSALTIRRKVGNYPSKVVITELFYNKVKKQLYVKENGTSLITHVKFWGYPGCIDFPLVKGEKSNGYTVFPVDRSRWDAGALFFNFVLENNPHKWMQIYKSLVDDHTINFDHQTICGGKDRTSGNYMFRIIKK